MNRSRREPTFTELLLIVLEGAWSIVVGLSVTFINFWRTTVTDRYPHHDPSLDWQPRPGYRGDFALITDKETGRLRCIGCQQCQNICPDKCILVVPEGKGKERHAEEFYIDAGLCMYCWLCVEVCPADALTMTPDYETATDDPRKLVRDLEYLRERGREYDDVLRVEAEGYRVEE